MTGSAASGAAGRMLCRILRLLAPLFPSRIPVLTYHSVDGSGSLLSVSPAQLRGHLSELRADRWRGLSIDEYGAALAEQKRSERAVLITFDDGYPSFYEEALPLLTEHGFKATVFVCSDFVGTGPNWLSRDAALSRKISERLGFSRQVRVRLDQAIEHLRQRPLMGWNQLRELVAAGIDVQSHGAAHHFLTTLPEPDLADDLARSRRVIEDALAVPVRAIAYPYGDCDRRVARAAGRAGYEIGFATDDRPGSGDRLMRYRSGVGGDLGAADLRLSLSSWPIYPYLRSIARRPHAWFAAPRRETRPPTDGNRGIAP